jgi:hypothetical protein
VTALKPPRPDRFGWIDWISYYNQLLKEQGEATDFYCARIHLPSGNTTWYGSDHTWQDGAGALIEGLMKMGFRFSPSLLTREKARPWPDFVTRTRLFFRALRDELRPFRKLQWKTPGPDRPLAVFERIYHVFQEAETLAVRQNASQAHGSLKSFLLTQLHFAVNETFMESPGSTRWHVVVDMRPYDRSDTLAGNHISNYVVELPVYTTAKAVNHTLREGLASRSFLGTRLLVAFSGKLGLLRMKVAQDYKKPSVSPKITGSFSSLGVWPPPGTEPAFPDDEMLIPVGNVSRMNPICACNIECGKKLGVSLQVHSSIAENKEQCERLMQRWVSLILAPASSPSLTQEGNRK